VLPFLLALTVPHIQALQVDYVSATAKKVQFAGDLTGWDTPKLMAHSGDHWTISFPLPANARVEYKLIVDGKWILDPNDPLKVDNGVGSQNSVFQGRIYRMNPREDAAPQHPLHRRSMRIAGRQVIVYTPESPAGKPLLIYGDGDTYESYGHIQNFVANLIDQKRMRPVILVLVPPKDRLKEYGAGWKTYAKYLLGSVLPAVRSATGASHKPSDVYVGGSSMGGVMALRLAEEFPTQVAGGVHCQSGAFQWTPLKLDNTDLIQPQALKKIHPGIRLHVDFGIFEDGLTKANEDLVQTLRNLNLPFEWAFTPEGHNWTAWRHRMVHGLLYLLPADKG
jgi:enterochelin esterase-like enzyme